MKEGITRETADIKFPKDSIVKNFYAIFFKLGWDFLSSPVVKIPRFQCRDAEDRGSTSGWGTKILYAEQRSQKINFKNIYY